MSLDLVTSSEECAVCTNGLLAFMVFDDGGWFLECQECLTGYLGLDTTGSQFRCEDLVDYRPATRQEVARTLGR